MNDFRFGLRMLVKSPGFALIAVLTLGLGIGANTAIFSLVHTVLLRPLPFAEQERLVALWKRDTTAGTPFVELALAEVRDWSQQAQTFSAISAMPATVYGYGYVLTGRGEAVQLESAKVSGDFFPLLGVQAAIGRVFTASDDVLNGAKVVVLSDRIWRERFHADPNLVGQGIMLSGDNFTVLGVMPAKFEFPKGVDLWIPIRTVVTARQTESYGASFLTAVGRLNAGASIEQAESELNTIIAGIAARHPEMEAGGHRIVITPLSAHLFGDARPALWMLLAATAMLLLIAIANIANLSMARATARRREFAMRAALGAGRGRLVRQLLMENGVLALAGGAAGILFAYGLIQVFLRLAPESIPRIEDVRLNLPVLLFSLTITGLASLLCGSIPAWTASRVNLNQVLNEGGSKMAGERAGLRLRSVLVITEVALTVVLLTGAMLILRSFVNLSRQDLGYDPSRVLTMHLRLQGTKYAPPEAKREFYRQLIAQLETKPGIESASAVLIRPMEGPVGWDVPFTLEGQTETEAKKNRVPNFEAVTSHYFRTFRIPLKAGREFNEQDTEQSPAVAIISETMARTLFGAGVDAIGKRIKLDLRDSPWATIVGIAGDTRYRELQRVRFDLYIPYAQWPMAFVNHFAVRTSIPPRAALETVRREIAALDPTQAITRVATMEEMVTANLSQPRFNAALLNWLSMLALLLAAVGIYGVLALSASQRTGEFGIRMALGAQRRDILKLVLGQGLRLAAIGIAVGAVASFALTRWISNLLYGVSASDPLTFLTVSALVIGIAILACWLPARGATRVDPMISLRHE